MQKLKVELPSPQENTPGSDYVACPGCKGEFNRLEDNGLCPDCSYEDQLKKKQKARQDLQVEVCLGRKGVSEYTFEGFKQRPENLEAFQACINFNPLVHNLYLHGTCGSGKTHLAGAAWRKRVGEGQSCEFLKHPDLNRLFRKKEADEEKELLKKFLAFDVLVIDDLGVGKSTEFANTILYEIIDLRISNYKNGLILTSNLSLEDFAAKVMDDRLPSRISGMCRVVKVGGPDFRLKQALK